MMTMSAPQAAPIFDLYHYRAGHLRQKTRGRARNPSPTAAWPLRIARASGARGDMLTGDLRSKIDAVWNAFWAGGIANPLEVIEQITYLLFMRGLDEAHTREENKANRLGKPMERRIFPKGKDDVGKDGGVAYDDMRWSQE